MGQDYLLTSQNSIMSVFLFVALKLSQVLSGEPGIQQENEWWGWLFALVEEQARWRAGSSPAVEMCGSLAVARYGILAV